MRLVCCSQSLQLINNNSKFIGQIATYEINKKITDCIVFFIAINHFILIRINLIETLNHVK